MTRLVALVLLLAACGSEPNRQAARRVYNEGLTALRDQQWESAQTRLLEARDAAAGDSELRYRAAFNLGLAYAGHADQLTAEDAEKAIELFSRGAAWFENAQSLRPKDEDARVNLEKVLHRRQLLVDQLNKGKNGLEARLGRLIEDERSLRDQARALVAAIDRANASSEPVAFQAQFEALATFERTLLADAGTILDLAGDELHLIEGKPEQELTDQENMRQVQLQNLSHYLERARAGLADTRRALRRLQGDRAHTRADQALADLKRAQDQLLSPDVVLKGIAQDQMVLTAHAETLARSAELSISGERSPIPAWLTPESLALRQSSLGERTDEIAARLEAGTSGEPPQDADPRTSRMLESARAALPFVQNAATAMRAAKTSLDENNLEPATDSERQAIEALVAAIERFANIRTLIELAYAEHTAALEKLAEAAEANLLRESIARNRDRLARMKGLLQVAEAEKQKYQLAESLRADAALAMEQMAAKLQRAPGEQAKQKLEELRRLFFSIVEHLQDLLREQSETHDGTASAQAAHDDERERFVGPLADAQERHTQRAEMLAGALEEQAEQAEQAAAQPTQPGAQNGAEQLAAAAVEVRSAVGAMAAARNNLGEARDQLGTMSVDMEPALEAQPQAMEHLQKAIELLNPPQHNDQDQQDQDRDQDQQDQDQDQDQPEQPQHQDEAMSAQEAQRRLQRIRDREAERDRRRRKPAQQEPVEKDW